MAVIVYSGGAFGSTLDYAMHEFSNELTKISAQVLDDGSMHSYHKEYHATTIDFVEQQPVGQYKTATIIYPGLDYLSPIDAVRKIKQILPPGQKVILIHFDTLDQVYRNQLFAYHKIPEYLNNVLKDKPRFWNPNYQAVSDMQIYECREALSLSMQQAPDYLQVLAAGDPNWMCVTPDDILYNFKNTTVNMLNYCELTLNQHCDIDIFYQTWFEKQQYIIEEFRTVQTIINSLQHRPTKWLPISIVGEAIVQCILRNQGWEISCHNLNQFPTTTQDLKKILINPGEPNEH